MSPEELAVLVEDACIDGWVTVPSTNPATPDMAYRITVVADWPVACTCRGYAGHGRCNHLDLAREVWQKTVPVGTVITEENEMIARKVHLMVDRVVGKQISTILWLHQPRSAHTTTVTLTRVDERGNVEIEVEEDLPGAPPPAKVTVKFAHALPLPEARRLLEFPPARRLLYDFVSTALTGEQVAMPQYWTP
jgi:hypothetical protein